MPPPPVNTEPEGQATEAQVLAKFPASVQLVDVLTDDTLVQFSGVAGIVHLGVALAL